MNLATLYARHGHAGLEALAESTGFSVPYLQKLLYVPHRRPSLPRAELLIEHSRKLFGAKEALTLEGLCESVYFKDAIKAALVDKTAHFSWVLKYR